jgi:hypothetical protein
MFARLRCGFGLQCSKVRREGAVFLKREHDFFGGDDYGLTRNEGDPISQPAVEPRVPKTERPLTSNESKGTGSNGKRSCGVC